MKKIYKMGSIVMFATQLMFGCSTETSKEQSKTTVIEGIVLNEKYTPERFSYIFTINTTIGKRAINIGSYYNEQGIVEIPIESIDTLIEKGTKVKIEVDNKEFSKQTYNVRADKIRILEK